MDIKIIAIDDEQDFLESVKRGLFISGHKNVKLESDPRNALNRFEQGESFDIALIDVAMPFMNGVELLESIRRISPDTKCIMITASAGEDVAEECLKKGASDFLLKPISKDELIAAVTRALE